MIFKMMNCDFGFTYNGVNYDFDHVDSLAIEDPESTKLIRGANGTSKTGLVYKEGIKEPKRVTVTILGVSLAIRNLLVEIYEDKARVDAYCVDRLDGSSKIAKNAILSQLPQQLTVDETPESMNVALIFESFDMVETHKS